MRSSGGGASMYVFFVSVDDVMDSGSGRWCEAEVEDGFVGFRTGEGEWDVCELAGWRSDELSRSCSESSVDSASELKYRFVIFR